LAAFATPDPAHWLIMRLVIAAGCAALADWLFYHQTLGLSLPLFLAAASIVAMQTNPQRADRRMRIAALALLALSLLALVDEVNTLSFVLGLMGTALAVILLNARAFGSWQRRVQQSVFIYVSGPYRLLDDTLRAMKLARQRNTRFAAIAAPLTWILPIFLF